ncbi:HEAT repeat domain-containing protein [Altericista sp. CCNU0014]|uniref:HEAT repeat domain-containing protein n=1 Tax=Altericista sp. CCNU0014 TaxID=3082949 RepID=UPI00384F3E80
MPISNELREMRFRSLCQSLLNDPSASVRAESALALGRLRDERATPNLCQALTDENEQVRINAVTALSILDESLTSSDIVTLLILLLRVPKAMSETPKYDLRGANIGNFAETVQGDQISTQQNYAAPQNLTEAAAEIQKLLEQLAQSNPAISEEQDQNAALEILHQEIKRSPTLKSRLLNALKSGGTEALKLALEAVFKNPLVAIPVETIKGWIEAE